MNFLILHYIVFYFEQLKLKNVKNKKEELVFKIPALRIICLFFWDKKRLSKQKKRLRPIVCFLRLTGYCIIKIYLLRLSWHSETACDYKCDGYRFLSTLGGLIIFEHAKRLKKQQKLRNGVSEYIPRSTVLSLSLQEIVLNFYKLIV